MIEPILEGPVEWANLSTVIKNQFTLNGRISEQHYFLHENTSSKVGPVWTKHMISSGILRACRRQDIREIRTYDPRSVFDLYKVLDKYSVVNKDVLVTGSLLPWIEVCCLAFGARTVTTVDYNPPVSEYEEIRTVGVEYFENETFKYDVIISYSRLEHDGLGRYGDSIDPEADIKRMRS